MPWTFTPYVLPLLLSAIVSAALAASAWRRRTAAPCAIPLSLMAFGAAEYALGYALELLAPDLQGKIFWAKIEYLGIASLAPCFLAFALEYAGFARHLSRRTVALLAAAVATTVLLAATNEAHGLIWTSTTLGREGSTSVLILARGPAFWAFAAWSYALLLMGGGLLLNAALHGVGLYRRQSLALLGGLLLPLLANAGYALGISPLPHLNPTPLVFTLSVVLFGLAIFRFRLLDLVPVARRALVEEMHEGVLVVDALGRVMDLNPAMGRMIGRPSTEVIGKPVEEALGDWPELAAHIREARPLEAEVSRGEDKARSEYALSVSLLLGQPGWPPGRLIVLRDITEMKRLEAQYLQAQKMELIGQLARGVAHDFNNALTAIQGYASLAGDHLPPTSPAREYLGRLLANADRAARLSQQLLAFSRRQPASPRQLILNDLIGDIHALLPRATAAEVCLETRPAPGLWPVHADPGQMEQVLLNLLVNALDAMPQGGRLTVRTANVAVGEEEARRLAAVPPGDYVALSVSDTGVGMSGEIRAHLFEPFFTTKQPGKGSGLGLATVYCIVRQHRGAIWVETEPGLGSTFTVYLPRMIDATSSPDEGNG